MTDQSFYNREIIKIIEPYSRVLDLGCGEGDLLLQLIQEKRVKARGIDIDTHCLSAAVGKGLSVTMQDLNKPLPGFKDQSYDYVILSRTLQVIGKPLETLHEMLRIGRKAIVIFPNFGYWSLRLQFLLTGKMPVSKLLPYQWHNTPNIHHVTIKDFRELCWENDIRIAREIPLLQSRQIPFGKRLFSNLMAEEGMYLLERRK